MERWYASDSKVRSLSQRTQQAAVCRAKSMRAGDRELPPPLVLLPSWHAILFHLYRAVTNPLLSRVLLLQPSLLSFYLSFVSCCESPDIQTRLVMLTLASIHHYHSRLRYGSCSLSHFPLPLSSFTFTKTLLTPHGLISSTIFIKVFTLNELDASLHLYCLS